MDELLDPKTIPDRFPVAVLMQRRPAVNHWLQASWRIVGVTLDGQQGSGIEAVEVRRDGEQVDYLWRGFQMRLYKDEVESYYHNLMAPKPSLYVITRNNGQGAPEPFLVSACFDEAHAYAESDADAHAVPLPAEIYGPVERFVLANYAPERKIRRKRKNWKDDA